MSKKLKTKKWGQNGYSQLKARLDTKLREVQKKCFTFTAKKKFSITRFSCIQTGPKSIQTGPKT